MYRIPCRRIAALTLALFINLSVTSVTWAAPIDEVREYLKKAYVEEVKPDILGASSIEEILKNLGDPYTNYLSADQYKNLQDSLRDDTSVSGIGVYFEPCPEGIVVLQVVPNSPAETAGIQKGDIITHADDKALAGLPTETSISLITGAENTMVKLTVIHNHQSQTYNLKRQQLVITSVNSELIDKHIGYLKLDNFGVDTNAHLYETFTSPDYKGVSHWIIDVRENPGGYLETVLETAGYFIGPDVSVLVKNRVNELRGAKASRAQDLVDKPVFLLVDESSASAAEVLAGALKDYQAALVIGKPTFGKGSVQTMYPLSDGGVLKITISKFFSPRGNTINKVGILPHLVIKQSDPQLVAYLLSGQAPVADKTGYLSIRLARQTYEVNLKEALSPDYKPAFTELLWALPPDTVIMLGSKSGWDYTTVEQISSQYQLGLNPRYLKDLNGANRDDILQLASRLLISGYPDKTFKPGQTITRAELAAMIASASGIKLPAGAVNFTDVPAHSWYAPQVAALKQAGIITGFDGKFNPDQTTSREEMLVVIARTHKYLTSALIADNTRIDKSAYKRVSPWALSEVDYLNQIGIVAPSTADSKAPATRGEAAAILAKTLMKAGII